MKKRILIFSSLLGLCGATSVMASDCVGDGCRIDPIIMPPAPMYGTVPDVAQHGMVPAVPTVCGPGSVCVVVPDADAFCKIVIYQTGARRYASKVMGRHDQ